MCKLVFSLFCLTQNIIFPISFLERCVKQAKLYFLFSLFAVNGFYINRRHIYNMFFLFKASNISYKRFTLSFLSHFSVNRFKKECDFLCTKKIMVKKINYKNLCIS